MTQLLTREIFENKEKGSNGPSIAVLETWLDEGGKHKYVEEYWGPSGYDRRTAKYYDKKGWLDERGEPWATDEKGFFDYDYYLGNGYKQIASMGKDYHKTAGGNYRISMKERPIEEERLPS